MENENQYIISAEGNNAILAQQANRIFKFINQRFNDLEYKASKNGKKPDVSRGEKMLLLHHLGVLDRLEAKSKSKTKLAKVLSLLLNASPDNIEKDLSDRKNPQSYLKTKRNYEFLAQTFGEAGLKEEKEKVDKILEDINKE